MIFESSPSDNVFQKFYFGPVFNNSAYHLNGLLLSFQTFVFLMCRSSRRSGPPKKPPRSRQRTAADMPPRAVGLLRRKAGSGGSSATPLSEDDEPVRRKHPSISEGARPVANGYRGGVSSEAESGAETKGREFASECCVHKYTCTVRTRSVTK